MIATPVILAFDTSGPFCACCLLRGDEIAAEACEAMDKGQAERLIALCEEVLAAGGAGWRDLGGIAVGTGPGNFTGVRIAVSAARGLALGLGVPAVGVTCLQALAHGLSWPVTVVADARRGEVYVQRFPNGAARIQGAADPVEGPVAGPADTVAMVRAIARIAAAGGGINPPAPFYLRQADALPPSDPPPVMLP